MKQNFTFLVVLLLALALPVNAAGLNGASPGITLIKSKAGFIFVFNEAPIHFTIEFAGNDLKPFQSERIVFKIDEKIVQMQRAKKSEFLQSSVNQNFKDSEILEKHRGWEESYLSDLLKAKLNVTSEKVTARTNREALLWHFPMPEGMNKQVDHQVFLTTVIGEQVLILNYSVEKGDTVANATKYLIESMNTLKVSDKPIDVKALQEEIRKG